jgi:TfoX/Sxy family transcriptional regulator of competence genes
MAYDEELADRIRELIDGEHVDREVRVSERRMFGGVAFLIDGHMAITASSEGGILARVDPSQADRLVARSGATVAIMRGGEMRGWLRVDSDRLRTRRQLAAWVERSVAHARTLPPKSSATSAATSSTTPSARSAPKRSA